MLLTTGRIPGWLAPRVHERVLPGARKRAVVRVSCNGSQNNFPLVRNKHLSSYDMPRSVAVTSQL
jgi:hypothetical protein